MAIKKAIIFGVSGMDGSYLAEFLIEKGYVVIGVSRRKSTSDKERIKDVLNNKRFKLINGDITDGSFLNRLVSNEKPDEIYNLAAQSFVVESWNTPIQTFEINALGNMKLLEAVRQYSPKTKFYFAASSEMFGKVRETPQKETTPFYPRSPYGVSKISGFWITVNYRESFGLFACSGILFNHESYRRGEEFVTKKITKALARIKYGLQKELRIGNLESKRDWGHSKDYVEAMYLMLQQEKPDDYVIATNETHSIRDFIELTIKYMNIGKIEWEGKGINEIGYINKKPIIIVDKAYFRPAEVDLLKGDYSKAKKILNWKPKIGFDSLVKEMIYYDLERAKEEYEKN